MKISRKQSHGYQLIFYITTISSENTPSLRPRCSADYYKIVIKHGLEKRIKIFSFFWSIGRLYSSGKSVPMKYEFLALLQMKKLIFCLSDTYKLTVNLFLFFGEKKSLSNKNIILSPSRQKISRCGFQSHYYAFAEPRSTLYHYWLT